MIIMLNWIEKYEYGIVACYLTIMFFSQLIPAISSLPFYTTLAPLVLVLGITAVKDAVDDFVSQWAPPA